MHTSLSAIPDPSRLTPYLMRPSLCILLLAGWAVLAVTDGVWAVPRESQEEKEVNLKRQATGGLFQKWTFDQDHLQKAPAGFTALVSGEGRPAEWTVQTYADAPSPSQILAVSSLCEAEPCDQLLLATGFKYEYPDLAVSFRIQAGASGIGGVVLGAQDASNYYAAVVDLAGATARVIRVVGGKEVVLAHTPVTLKRTEWHSLRVQRNTIISKDFIETFVDGVLVLSVEDQALGLGQVGLMARGKSALLFDTFHAVPLFSHRPLSSPPAY
ncbi:MAG: hypothetical protein K2Q17_18375 [Nitrospiraceae bacterium]|nr:hypothetical protein [Nitrospiraceae bacterium]